MNSPTPLTRETGPYGADLSDPGSFVEGVPHETFARLRREAPVAWHPDILGGGFWVVTKYKDVWNVSLDPATFSSGRGTALLKESTPDELAAQSLLMLNMDPPQHTKYRRIVNMGFSPRMTNRLEPHIREATNAILDKVAPHGHCDFVTDVAAELPLQVIVELLGVPLEDRAKVFEWSNTMIGMDDPEYGGSTDDGKMASMQLFMYANELAAQRRAAPKDDLTTLLLNAQVDGEQLSEGEFDAFMMLLSVAGNETTRNQISHGMLALFEHPDQQAALVNDPGLINTAVEEFVRWASPVMHFRRTAQRDVELHGQKIREGDRVSIWYVSANRDEDAFDTPSRFDIRRHPNEHLGFGIGPHFCLGANLARLEIRVMFEELLRRFPDIRPAGPVSRLRSNFINGIKHMPVEFTPER
jgi:cholest-4-en-3-one 26-monooxygenase